MRRPGLRPDRGGLLLSLVALLLLAWLLSLGGCADPTGPRESWVVQCFDVWGHETTARFYSYEAARAWRYELGTRKPGGPNPMICTIYTEAEYGAQH
jgi:hypothetical protein